MRSLGVPFCVVLCGLLTLSAPTLAAGTAAPREGQLALNAAQALIDQQLGSIQATLAVLATAGEVQSLEWDTMRPLLSSFQQHCPPCVIWFTKPDGTYYSVENGLMSQSLADRGYFKALIGGKEILGDVVVSKSSGQFSAVVAVPVYHEGRVAGALGASVFAKNMSEFLAASLGLPAGMRLLVLSADGQTVCAIPAGGPEWPDDAKAASSAKPASVVEVELGGEQLTVMNKESDFNGWRYLIGIPR